MQGLTSELLRGLWYVAAPSRDLKPGRFLAKTMLGAPLIIGRDNAGRVFALKDICPHRGIPLRHGSFDGQAVQCCYHGWRFDTSGQCVEIPSMREGQAIDLAKIQVGAYPCVEQQGILWVFFAHNGETPEQAGEPAPPLMPDFAADVEPQFHCMLPFQCSTDHAAFGLMDPTHAAFVHTSWWFKSGAKKLRPKEKHFAPADLGWAMVRHDLPPQNIAYKILGTPASTEITYRLPGLRVENIRGAKRQATGLTAITPVNEGETEVHQFFWTSAPWLSAFKPVLQHLMWVFVDQDRRVVVQQREGLIHNPKLMLINDADTQARWWMRVKDAYLKAQADGKPFENPLQPMTLRWRS